MGVRPAQHVFRDGRLTDLNAELEQLPVDARSSPERVGKADLTDQFACLRVHGFAPRSGPPTPVEPKALAVPLDHSGGLHQHHRFEATRPQPVEPHPDQTIHGAQPQTPDSLTIEDRHLMTKGDELEFQFCTAANPTTEPREECRDQCEHAGDITDCPVKPPAFSLLSDFR
jgi:hypothetical protein